MRAAIVLSVLLCASASAEAARHACLDRLDDLSVPYRPAKPKKGIDVPVEITGPVGGVTYKSWHKKPLVLDCSLVYSLAVAGRFLVAAGITEAFYTSAYQRRNVRGTSRPSRHSFGLALDVHELIGAEVGKLSVADHFEQGLGDAIDCIGTPLTRSGTVMQTVFCRMERSGLFRLVLSPDYDEDHYNHFHVEALPWKERKDLDLRRDGARNVGATGRPSGQGSSR